MDFDISQCPHRDIFSYFAKDGSDWPSVRYFLHLAHTYGHEQFTVKLCDDRAMLVIATPEMYINLARQCEARGRIATESPHLLYYKRCHPMSLIQDKNIYDKPTIMVVKTGNKRLKFLLFMLTDEFYNSHKLFADLLKLDFTPAFPEPEDGD